MKKRCWRLSVICLFNLNVPFSEFSTLAFQYNQKVWSVLISEQKYLLYHNEIVRKPNLYIEVVFKKQLEIYPIQGSKLTYHCCSFICLYVYRFFFLFVPESRVNYWMDSNQVFTFQKLADEKSFVMIGWIESSNFIIHAYLHSYRHSSW